MMAATVTVTSAPARCRRGRTTSGSATEGRCCANVVSGRPRPTRRGGASSALSVQGQLSRALGVQRRRRRAAECRLPPPRRPRRHLSLLFCRRLARGVAHPPQLGAAAVPRRARAVRRARVRRPALQRRAHGRAARREFTIGMLARPCPRLPMPFSSRACGGSRLRSRRADVCRSDRAVCRLEMLQRSTSAIHGPRRGCHLRVRLRHAVVRRVG